jgi:hypothetical protein
MDRRQVSRGQKALVIIVVIGTIVISLIGFVGSYDAVLRLAQRNGFGWFSYLLPIGVDVGITVFLALDLLLTWMRIPLPILRQLAWVLTGATIVFNAASAWPKLLSSAMHAVVPLLFVAAIEAARHTVGRLAQIEANQLFERTRLGRWIWAPLATLRLFRRRMLWELRSYEEALEMERRRLVYRARLRAAYGRLWRYRAPVDHLLLLKLANLGEPLPAFRLDTVPALPAPVSAPALPNPASAMAALAEPREEEPAPVPGDTPVIAADADGGQAPLTPAGRESPALAAEPMEEGSAGPVVPKPGPGAEKADSTAETAGTDEAASAPQPEPASVPEEPQGGRRAVTPSPGSAIDRYRAAFVDYTQRHGEFPDGEQLAKWLFEQYGVTGRTGGPLTPGHLRRYLPGFKEHWEAEQRATPRR